MWKKKAWTTKYEPRLSLILRQWPLGGAGTVRENGILRYYETIVENRRHNDLFFFRTGQNLSPVLPAGVENRGTGSPQRFAFSSWASAHDWRPAGQLSDHC